jgi:diguanylate cyclase
MSMALFFRSLQARRGIVLAALTVFGVLLLGLLAILGIDLAPLLTLRTVTQSGLAVIETRYNPIGFLGLGLLAAAVCSCGLALVQFLQPLIAPGRPNTAEWAVSASKTLKRELASVLDILRNNIATNEAYGRSLDDAQKRLGKLPQAEQVRIIVSLLISENERLRLSAADDRRKIEASAHEIETLQASLRGAEEATLKDPLTGSGNRRLFDTAVQKAVEDSNRRDTPLSLIMCDIDHFKRINDMFGHHVGDEIIKALARVIEASARETDSVARYGGEEFAIILPGTKLEGAKETAERIRRNFGTKQFAIRSTNQKIGQVTASFGVAEHRPGDDVETFVQNADAMLYEAKAGGRDRVAYFRPRQ